MPDCKVQQWAWHGLSTDGRKMYGVACRMVLQSSLQTLDSYGCRNLQARPEALVLVGADFKGSHNCLSTQDAHPSLMLATGTRNLCREIQLEASE